MADPLHQTEGVSFVLETDAVKKLMAQAPRAAYFWLRAYLGEITVQHRVQWLRQKGTSFGRRRADGTGITVSRLNEGNNPPEDDEVAYFVEPRERRQETNAAAAGAIGKLRADIFTGNKILPVHEFGIDITSRGYMAVPIKTRPGNIQKWKKAHQRARLITLPSKRDSSLLVYEQIGRRPRGRPSKTTPQKVTIKLRLRWVLRKHVDMHPTLRLYNSWDGLRSARDTVWSKYATRMLKDIEDGVTD